MGQQASLQAERPPAVAGQGGQEPPVDDGVTWWCKLLAKAICVFSGISAMFMGFWSCFTISAICLAAGIFLILEGFAIIVLEAPFCCQFLDFIQPISQFSARRTYWQKAALYSFPPFVPFIMCRGLSIVFGCCLLLASGVIYGMLALGRKADRETMLDRARGASEDVEMKETLITNEVLPDPTPTKPT